MIVAFFVGFAVGGVFATFLLALLTVCEDQCSDQDRKKRKKQGRED